MKLLNRNRSTRGSHRVGVYTTVKVKDISNIGLWKGKDYSTIGGNRHIKVTTVIKGIGRTLAGDSMRV